VANEDVFFVDAGPLADAALLPERVASVLGVRPSAGQSILQALSAELARWQLLIVLDNLEHLAGAAPVITGLLSVAPKLRLLVTSRAPLHARGEHLYPVPPLAVRPAAGGPAGAVAPAIALFADRACAADPHFVLSADMMPVAAGICRELDGLPLAIELAVAWLRLLPPARLLARLDRRLDLLADARSDRPGRQQTLRAAIDWSYQLLDPPARRAYRALGVFRGGWTLAGAAANHLQPADLRAHLTGARQRVPVTLDGLAAATGRSPHCLSYALPELRPGADPVLAAHVRRTICWRCAARRGDFRSATVRQPAEVNICPSHLIWLGSAVHAHRSGQHYVGDLPEIIRAQRRHCRPARCHGRQATADAFAEAAHITALWAHHGFHCDRRIPLIRAFPGRAPPTGKLQPGDPSCRLRPIPRPSTWPACSLRLAGAIPPPLPARTNSANSSTRSISTSESSTTPRTASTTPSSAGSASATDSQANPAFDGCLMINETSCPPPVSHI